jgi:hypothetical protein
MTPYANQSLVTDIYGGNPVNYYWAAPASGSSADGNFATATSWTPNGVPSGIDSVNFNLSSAATETNADHLPTGYIVTLPNATQQVANLTVVNDNVTLDEPGIASYFYISTLLSVTKGTLEISNSQNNATNLFEANAVAVGTNTSTGKLTIGQSVYLYTDNDTAINAGSTLTVAPGGKLETYTLTIAGTTNAWTGTLDINQSALKITNGDIATVMNQLKTGFNNGTWTGKGIISSAAAADSTHLTAVGAILNNDGNGNKIYGSGTALGVFDGQNGKASGFSIDTDNALTDVLIRYTYYGDANLDGTVDGSDYTLIDHGFSNHLTGWYNGDFNYDGKVDGSDYTLIDNAFNNQGSGLGLSNDAIPALLSGTAGATGHRLGTSPGGVLNVSPTSDSQGGVSASSTSQFASVPEPTSMGLFAIGAAALLNRRSRRRGNHA